MPLLLLHRLRHALRAAAQRFQRAALRADSAFGIAVAELAFGVAHRLAGAAELLHAVLLTLLALLAHAALAAIAPAACCSCSRKSLLVLAQFAHTLLALLALLSLLTLLPALAVAPRWSCP